MNIINVHACVLLLYSLCNTCAWYVSKEHWTISGHLIHNKIIPKHNFGTKEINKNLNLITIQRTSIINAQIVLLLIEGVNGCGIRFLGQVISYDMKNNLLYRGSFYQNSFLLCAYFCQICILNALVLLLFHLGNMIAPLYMICDLLAPLVTNLLYPSQF